MTCNVSEHDLWSGIDRQAPEVLEHLRSCPSCRDRAHLLQAGIDAVASSGVPTPVGMPDKIGPYRILSYLGEGGMGIVYEGEQPRTKRSVAIKVIRGGRDDEYRVRLFQREAQTLARLRHPAIGAIYEAGRTEGGVDYFAMELIAGVPLTNYAREESLPLPTRLALFRKVCEAITYAHQRGVIHRDLKPSNILVDEEGNPKILDFGLARITDPDEGVTLTGTEVGQIMGTLPYMSPEEARGDLDMIGVQSDVYSLGVVFYELLTDQLPLNVRRHQLHEAVRIISEDMPVRPGQINRALRGDLETMAMKALEKDPERRYVGPAAMAEDIHRYLTDRPILARPASGWYRFRKLLLRHKLFVFTLATMLSVLLSAAYWVSQAERGLQDGFQREARLLEQREGILERELAKSLHGGGQLAAAEPHYRQALRTFERLDLLEDVVSVSLALSELLVDRHDPEDLIACEELILKTLDRMDQDPAQWASHFPDALGLLKRLYGPALLNDPERLREVDAEIKSRAGS